MNVVMLRRKKLGLTSCQGIASHSKTGITFIRNDMLHTIPPPDMVIRWGCTSNVPTDNVVNHAKAIHLVSDKLEFRKTLQGVDLCPETWFDYEKWKKDLGSEQTILPAIVRPRYHHQGLALHYCETPQQVLSACGKIGGGNYYISTFIPKVKEYRVFVVQGRVACVAEKIPADDKAVAWNVAQGGKFVNVKWDSWHYPSVDAAIKAMELSKLVFGGVDVMIDNEGNPYVIEINSAPSLTSDYRQQCMAKCFDYIVEHGKEKLPLGTATGKKAGWRNYLHPSINHNAVV